MKCVSNCLNAKSHPDACKCHGCAGSLHGNEDKLTLCERQHLSVFQNAESFKEIIDTLDRLCKNEPIKISNGHNYNRDRINLEMSLYLVWMWKDANEQIKINFRKKMRFGTKSIVSKMKKEKGGILTKLFGEIDSLSYEGIENIDYLTQKCWKRDIYLPISYQINFGTFYGKYTASAIRYAMACSKYEETFLIELLNAIVRIHDAEVAEILRRAEFYR